MSDQIFTNAASVWIGKLEKTRKLTKHQRQAVIAFSMWLDEVIRQEEVKERMEHGKKS